MPADGFLPRDADRIQPIQVLLVSTRPFLPEQLEVRSDHLNPSRLIDQVERRLAAEPNVSNLFRCRPSFLLSAFRQVRLACRRELPAAFLCFLLRDQHVMLEDLPCRQLSDCPTGPTVSAGESMLPEGSPAGADERLVPINAFRLRARPAQKFFSSPINSAGSLI